MYLIKVEYAVFLGSKQKSYRIRLIRYKKIFHLHPERKEFWVIFPSVCGAFRRKFWILNSGFWILIHYLIPIPKNNAILPVGLQLLSNNNAWIMFVTILGIKPRYLISFHPTPYSLLPTPYCQRDVAILLINGIITPMLPDLILSQDD